MLHQISCPHTPEQNGKAERRHRSIGETGLSLLFQSGVPNQFWVHAFQTVVRLLNRRPT